MTELTTAWMLGCVCGFFLGVTIARPPRDRDPDWRRSINHENVNRPSGPPPLKFRRHAETGQALRLDPGSVQRGYGNGEPAVPKPTIIPKPQFPAPRKVTDNFL